MSTLLVPLAVFAVIVVIVAMAHVARIHDGEIEVHHKLYARGREHQRKMRELELELARIKHGTY
jgi:DNA-directed RNA polymerase specialized sigma subunit